MMGAYAAPLLTIPHSFATSMKSIYLFSVSISFARAKYSSYLPIIGVLDTVEQEL
jgi:hypothetical protein